MKRLFNSGFIFPCFVGIGTYFLMYAVLIGMLMVFPTLIYFWWTVPLFEAARIAIVVLAVLECREYCLYVRDM